MKFIGVDAGGSKTRVLSGEAKTWRRSPPYVKRSWDLATSVSSAPMVSAG